MEYKEFESRIKSAENPVVVDFWAPWCIPCRAMNPILKKMQEKYDGQVEILKLNSDESLEIIHKLGIHGVPTLMGFRHGEIVFRKTGSQTGAVIDQLFASLAGTEPQTIGLTGFDRGVRAGVGFLLIAAGIAVSWSYWLIGLGGLVLFSAIYDRCPVYNAIMPRIKKLFKRISLNQKESI